MAWRVGESLGIGGWWMGIEVRGVLLSCVRCESGGGKGGVVGFLGCFGSSRVSSPRRPMPEARKVHVRALVCVRALAVRVQLCQGLGQWATAQQRWSLCAGIAGSWETRWNSAAYCCRVGQQVAVAWR